MSKDITIQINGVANNFDGVEEVKTNQFGGGSITWVPEDETQLATLTVTKNGSYTAEDAGVYGFSTVIVNVPAAPSSITGRDTDGNDYTVTVDDNGYIVETLTASSIQVTTPPTTLDYTDGDTIDFTGIVVKAYDGEENLFDVTGYAGGVVPVGELQFPVTVAVYDEESAGGGEPIFPDYQDSGVVKATGFIRTEDALAYSLAHSGYPITDALKEQFLAECYPYCTQFVTIEYTGNPISGVHYYSFVTLSDVGYNAIVNQNVTLGNNTYTRSYLRETHIKLSGTSGPYSGTIGHDRTPTNGGFLGVLNQQGGSVISGLNAETPGGSTQEIPAIWPRPGDGKLLSATFEINVGPGEDESKELGDGDDGFTGNDGDF